MPKYRITIGRDRSEYAEVEVEADDINRATGLALTAAETDDGKSLVWTIDQDSIIGGVYLGAAPELVVEDDDAG